MPKLLEVIVTSVEDAREAEAGGADRLELVRALDQGGLTPAPGLVRSVTEAVSIPVRVMLRREPTLWISSSDEIQELQKQAEQFARLPIAGFVLGFVREEQIDLAATLQILCAAGPLPVTFHRAFDEAADPFSAIDHLKKVQQVDRILTSGGPGEWPHRKQKLLSWQRAAKPEITILVGAGLCPSVLKDVPDAELPEVHVGRAARVPQSVAGVVQRAAVRSVKSALG